MESRALHPTSQPIHSPYRGTPAAPVPFRCETRCPASTSTEASSTATPSENEILGGSARLVSLVSALPVLALLLGFLMSGPHVFGQGDAEGAVDERAAFEAALKSDSPFEWTTAIGRESGREVASDPRPEWVLPTLRHFLDMDDRPERTAFLWTADKKKNPLWESALGRDLIESLLSDEDLLPRTAERTREVLSYLVSDNALHLLYAEKLRTTTSTSYYQRAFPILADYRPNFLVGDAILRLSEPGDLNPAAVQAALRQYLAPLAPGLETVEQWTSFWESNRHRSLGRLLMEAVAELEGEKRLEIWQAAAKSMEETDALSGWLLDGLATDQLISIRVDAMRRIRNYALKHRGAGGDSEVRMKELLRRSLLLAGNEKEKSSLRVLAIDAIGEMVDFKDNTGVTDLLKQTIDKLSTAKSGSAEHALGLAAIRVVGALQADLATELVSVLAGEVVKAAEGWANVDRVVVVQVLESLRNTELPIETLPHLRKIFDATTEEPTKDLVLQIFLRIDLDKFPLEGKKRVLEFYRELVKNRTFVAKAIAGIDYLRLEDGIEVLQELAGDDQVARTSRIQAVDSIAAIGGGAAMSAFSQLLATTADPVRSHVLKLAIAECAEDSENTLLALEALVIENAALRPPSTTPWFLEVVLDPVIDTLLLKESGFWVFGADSSPPAEVFTRWWIIEWACLDRLSSNAAAQKSVEDERKKLQIVENRTRRILAAVSGDAVDFPIEELTAYADDSKARVSILVGLSEGDFASALAAVTDSSQSNDSYTTTVKWLLSRLPRFEVREGESEFLTAVKKVGVDKGYSLAAEIETRLAELKLSRKPTTDGKAPGSGKTGQLSPRLDALGRRR